MSFIFQVSVFRFFLRSILISANWQRIINFNNRGELGGADRNQRLVVVYPLADDGVEQMHRPSTNECSSLGKGICIRF